MSTAHPMEAANAGPISTYGTRFVELFFGEKQFGWDWVPFLPLGTDFRCAYGLLSNAAF